MSKKFSIGDHVKMVAWACQVNKRARSFTGVVVGYSVKHPDQVRLKRDGLHTVELWSEEAWELNEPPSMLEAVGRPC